MQRGEADAALAQFGDHVDEVLEAAAVAVERGDDEGVAGGEEGVARFNSGRSAFLPDFLSAKIFRHPAAGRASGELQPNRHTGDANA